MPSTVQPVVVTADLARLLAVYVGLLGATETQRVPPEGPLFYLSLRIGNSDLGLVSVDGTTDAPGRVLLSVEVPDVDALLPEIAGLGLGRPAGIRMGHGADVPGRAGRTPGGMRHSDGTTAVRRVRSSWSGSGRCRPDR